MYSNKHINVCKSMCLNSHMHMGIYMIGWLVGWVLWHINLYRSFNTKFRLYIHTYSTKDFKTNIKVGRIFY